MQTVEETPVVLNPDRFVRERCMGRRRARIDMRKPGRSTKFPITTHNGHARYEVADRRAVCSMCEWCIRGEHKNCQAERCPCVCNDSDFRFSRNKLTAIGAIPVDMAKLAQIWGQPIDSATVCPTVAKS